MKTASLTEKVSDNGYPHGKGGYYVYDCPPLLSVAGTHDPKQPGVGRVSFTKLVWTWFSGKMTPELSSCKPCSLRNYLEIDRVRILKLSAFSKEKWEARTDLRH